MNGRPDPITGKVTVGALAGAAAGGGLGAVIDLLTHTPPGSTWLEWLQWGLTLAGAVLAVWAQAQRAKRDTTPVDDPMDRAGNQLVAVGRHETRPDDGSRFLDDWADDTDPPPRPPITH